ncbi:MAG: 2-(1,2-epoxy-1,2-dihydrophenyl)acetyl-CoA isomerase [Rhodobacteraceae bacterium]|nr:2-(1,2-epoxy-1,2-dihydrophenyl)acetyl-CoA isomerase [Paracoccaceae bacterium]
MHYDTIKLELRDDIAVITLNRPHVMNALNTQMRAEITQAVTQSSKDARVVVLTGEGKAFCSGQDLGDRQSVANLDLERTLRDEYEPMLHAIIKCPVPTVTALNGPAAGAGANLALAADVVIGAKSSYLMQAFSKIGLIPDAGGSYIIMAEDAANSGMIWEAVEDEQFETTWRARAAHLASGPTVTYGHIKSALRQSWDNSLGDQLALEAKLQKACGETHDFKEGVLAFLDKRAPKFEGR